MNEAISRDGGAGRRLRRRMRIALAAVAAVGIAASAILRTSSRPQPVGPVSGVQAVQLAKGVSTTVERGDRVTLRASADVINLRPVRAFGPFRIGFIRSVEARNVTIETFDATRQDERSVASGGFVMEEAIAALTRKTLDGVMHADVENVHLTRHAARNEVLTLTASSCESTGRHNRFICRHGTARSGRGEITFLEAVCDRTACRLDGVPWP